MCLLTSLPGCRQEAIVNNAMKDLVLGQHLLHPLDRMGSHHWQTVLADSIDLNVDALEPGFSTREENCLVPVILSKL